MKTAYLILAAMLAALSAQAQQGPTVSFGASTLGATLEAGYRVNPYFGLRGIAGMGRADFSSNYNGAPLTGSINIGGVGLLADVYFGGGGRISAGGIAPNYSASLSATGDIVINGTSFTNIDISGQIDTINRFAPVLAIGYDKSFGNSWGMSADIGAIYTGGFSLTATDNSAQISQVDLDADLASTNAELGQATILPFVKLSVYFAF